MTKNGTTRIDSLKSAKPNPWEGFYRLSREGRLKTLAENCDLNENDLKVLTGETPFSLDIAENLIENVVGVFPLPLGIATNLVVDDQSVVIPMAVEETSIIAACSSVAKWVSAHGGVKTEVRGRLIIGQIQLPLVYAAEEVVTLLKSQESELVNFANAGLPGLVERGGGVERLEFRILDRASDGGEADLSGASSKMVVIHILCNPCDAMGANLINQVCEALKPKIESLTGQKVGLCILSNLVDTKLIRASVEIPEIVSADGSAGDQLQGVEPGLGLDSGLGHGIQEAWLFAQSDPYRAATHNKGVLNGIDPVLIATGNDWRAVEAGIHAYAARSGKYRPVTQWTFDRARRKLRGQIEIPMALGTVGGVTRIHPTAQVALKIMKISSAEQLARIITAVGLIQNLGALRALASVGIVKGHMQLHAANLAIAAGASVHEVSVVRDRLKVVLQQEKKISLVHAQKILREVRGEL